MTEKIELRLPMDDIYDEAGIPGYIKSYMFLKGYSVGKNLPQMKMALSLARKLHDGQYRKDGSPYLQHPLKVCSTLISYGIEDDVTLSAALLHDALEDCMENLPQQGEELCTKYHLSTEVLDIVKLLTKRSGLNDDELNVYFKNIEENPKAALVKLADRLHNSSTLYTFTPKKMRKYIRETDLFLLPMASYCKKFYPEFGNAFGILKNGIEGMNRSMDVMLQKIEEQENSQQASV